MRRVPEAPQTLDAALVVHVWMEPDDPTLRGRILAPQPVDASGTRGVTALCDVVCALLRRLEDGLAAEHRSARANSGDPPPD
jgi:hypothetical protein